MKIAETYFKRILTQSDLTYRLQDVCVTPLGSLKKDENIPEYLRLKHSVVQVTTIPVKHAICIKRCVVRDKK